MGQGRRHPLSKAERKVAATLYEHLRKDKAMMGKSNDVEYANYVAMAGYVKSMKVQEENAFLLVDVTGKESGGVTKWIPVTCYKEPELLSRLERYGKDDFIKLRGYVRAWSQKKDGEWRNAVDIRITELLSKDPEKRERKRESTRGREPGEDDAPW